MVGVMSLSFKDRIRELEDRRCQLEGESLRADRAEWHKLFDELTAVYFEIEECWVQLALSKYLGVGGLACADEAECPSRLFFTG
jgi:hypothetical protein